MSYLDRLMRQTATHWAVGSGSVTYDKYGDPAFAAPVLLTPASGNAVRWETKATKYITKNGDEDHGHSTVYSATDEFSVGDYLFLGSSVATNPESVDGADRVKYAEKVTDVANRKTLYKCIL